MSALEEVLAALRTAVEQAEAARGHASEALDRWNERGEILAEHLQGSNDPDVQDVLQSHLITSEELWTAWERVGAVLTRVEQYAFQLQGEVSGGGDLPGGGSAGGGAPKSPPPVEGPDGSKYPPDAAWAADIMPPRVKTGQPNQKTIGYADRELNQPFTSGNDQEWSPRVQQRLRERGIPLDMARRLKSHVELKVAARMIERGQTHSELVINHVPCGSQQGTTGGCHAALDKFLPEGTTLTVHGTTPQGTPYSHTYRGTT